MTRIFAMMLLAVAAGVTTAQSAGDDVSLQVVKYDGLKDVILKNRGKVVFVDFWADF